jgi:hypothetical protein
MSFEPEDLFSSMINPDAQVEAELMFQNFELDNGSVRCPDACTLHTLIPYVKQLVRLFPHIKEKVKDQLSSSRLINRVSA